MPEIIPLFITPVYKNKIRSLTDQELNFINSVNMYKQGLGNNTSDNKYLLDSEELKDLKSVIENNINCYAQEVMKTEAELYITNSWKNSVGKNQDHQIHNHTNSVISGVVYIKVNNSQPSLTFNRLTPPFLLNYFPTEFNVFNSIEWTVPVDDLDILIFPSSCYHYVKVNETDNNRISIAFNTFMKGKIGTANSGADLNL